MRKAAVAGKFYPRNEENLKKEINKYLNQIKQEKEGWAKAAISPHAGYRFSGKVAAKSIAALEKKETYIILGPSHHGTGAGISLSNEKWRTPLGEIEVNKEIINELKEIGIIENRAHKREHSIEVQTPFLQYLHKEFKIVPIMMSLQDKETIIELGNKLSRIKEERDVAILGSSDFTHYKTKKVAEEQDKEAIQKIKELDLDGFLELINKKNYSICGYGPIGTTMLVASKQDLIPELIDYRTSADATGDTNQVVGYASIIFK